MNIFVLDLDPVLAAQYHCNRHVVKMITEHVQMLSTIAGRGFAPSFHNHPCTLWCGASFSNYRWLVQLTDALHDEYRLRFGKDKTHASWLIMDRELRDHSLPMSVSLRSPARSATGRQRSE